MVPSSYIDWVKAIDKAFRDFVIPAGMKSFLVSVRNQSMRWKNITSNQSKWVGIRLKQLSKTFFDDFKPDDEPDPPTTFTSPVGNKTKPEEKKKPKKKSTEFYNPMEQLSE